eukprot:4416223-Prymnesium_polylepis.1
MAIVDMPDLNADQYDETHDVGGFVATMLAELEAQQPADPYLWMMSHIALHRGLRAARRRGRPIRRDERRVQAAALGRARADRGEAGGTRQRVVRRAAVGAARGADRDHPAGPRAGPIAARAPRRAVRRRRRRHRRRRWRVGGAGSLPGAGLRRAARRRAAAVAARTQLAPVVRRRRGGRHPLRRRLARQDGHARRRAQDCPRRARQPRRVPGGRVPTDDRRRPWPRPLHAARLCEALALAGGGDAAQGCRRVREDRRRTRRGLASRPVGG